MALTLYLKLTISTAYKYIIPAKINDKLVRLISEAALSIYKAIGCRHYARVDFLLDSRNLNSEQAKICIKILLKADEILGVIENKIDISYEAKKLIKMRNEARSKKDWSKADEIRDKIYDLGVVIEDTPEGTIWKKR